MNKLKIVLVIGLIVVALTFAKIFSSEPVMAQTATMKVCSVLTAGQWRDSVTVPSGWTKPTCVRYQNAVRASEYQLGCLQNDSYNFGTFGGGLPAPNCGWR